MIASCQAGGAGRVQMRRKAVPIACKKPSVEGAGKSAFGHSNVAAGHLYLAGRKCRRPKLADGFANQFHSLYRQPAALQILRCIKHGTQNSNLPAAKKTDDPLNPSNPTP